MGSLLFKSPGFIEALEAFKRAEAFVDGGLVIAEEGFSDIAKRVLFGVVDDSFRSILDIFNGVITLMNVGGVFDKLTYYSPLQDLYKTRALTIRKALGANLPVYKTIPIPKPRSMVGTYSEVLTTNRQIFTNIDMGSFVGIVSVGVERLIDLLSSSATDKVAFDKELSQIVVEVTHNERRIADLSKQHDKQFKGDPTKEQAGRFEVEFGEIHNLSNFIELMKKDFTYLIKVGEMRKKVTSQSELIRKMISKLEEREDITSKNNLKMLIRYCQHIASVYQLYGATCLTHMAMETNLCIVLEEIMKLYFK